METKSKCNLGRQDILNDEVSSFIINFQQSIIFGCMNQLILNVELCMTIPASKRYCVDFSKAFHKGNKVILGLQSFAICEFYEVLIPFQTSTPSEACNCPLLQNCSGLLPLSDQRPSISITAPALTHVNPSHFLSANWVEGLFENGQCSKVQQIQTI